MSTKGLVIGKKLLCCAAGLLLAGEACALEYGKQEKDAIQVSLPSVLNNPAKFAEKRIAVWGVVGGYTEHTFIFLTHDHAHWRDLSSAVSIEPHASLKNIAFGSVAWRDLYGRAVCIEGVLRAEKIDDKQWMLLLVAEHIFVPEDDRQTGQNVKRPADQDPKQNNNSTRPDQSK